MVKGPKEFRRRADFCEKRIKAVSARLIKAAGDSIPDNLCAYVTGSYGRLEASPYSDIDIFFVLNNSNAAERMPKVDEHHLYSALAKICKGLKLPEFSNDGEYLRVHQLTEILENVGNPKDDFSNNFTARMLLLLESRLPPG